MTTVNVIIQNATEERQATGSRGVLSELIVLLQREIEPCW